MVVRVAGGPPIPVESVETIVDTDQPVRHRIVTAGGTEIELGPDTPYTVEATPTADVIHLPGLHFHPAQRRAYEQANFTPLFPGR